MSYERDIISQLSLLEDINDTYDIMEYLLLEAVFMGGAFLFIMNLIIPGLLVLAGGIVGFTVIHITIKDRLAEYILGNLFEDTETKISDKIFLEQIRVISVDTVITPLDPFPYSNLYIKEDELVESASKLGKLQMYSEDEFKKDIEKLTDKEVKRRLMDTYKESDIEEEIEND